MAEKPGAVWCRLGFHKRTTVVYAVNQFFPPQRVPPVKRRLFLSECVRCGETRR